MRPKRVLGFSLSGSFRRLGFQPDRNLTAQKNGARRLRLQRPDASCLSQPVRLKTYPTGATPIARVPAIGLHGWHDNCSRDALYFFSPRRKDLRRFSQLQVTAAKRFAICRVVHGSPKSKNEQCFCASPQLIAAATFNIVPKMTFSLFEKRESARIATSHYIISG